MAHQGGGAAHTREKIVAAAAARFVVIASSDKVVERLHPPVPLELLAFRLPATLCALAAARVRGVPASPDGGVIANYFGPVDDPGAVSQWLASTPGVIDHGLFPPTLVTDLIIARGPRVEMREVGDTNRSSA